MVVEAGSASASIEAARKLGVQIIELRPQTELGAGAFALACASVHRDGFLPGLATPEDVALILHTSGTTSRPKIVPLSHHNVSASARNVAATLELTPADRGLAIMPLFHIHGLIAGLLAPLSRGGACSARPDSTR